MSAAIICPALCISDVIDKAGICDRSIKYVTSQFGGLKRERSNMGSTPRSSNSKQKQKTQDKNTTSFPYKYS